jgi:uncharacterized protein (DUF2249 family)/CRP-like cAMP-binding protein
VSREPRSDSGGRAIATKVDVRAIRATERHPLIFARFDALLEGGAMELTTDHEPRPLRAEFEAAHPGAYAWEQRRVGEGHWVATIRKLAAPSGDRAFEALRRSSAFGPADPGELHGLATRARIATVRRGRAVVEQGVLWPYVGVVAEGTIQAMLIAPDGREVALYDLFAGDVFGTVSLADGGVSPLRFVARGRDTVVVLIPVEAAAAVIDGSDAVARAVHALDAQRLRSIVRRFAQHVGQPVAARVAEALLAYASPQPGFAKALDPLPGMAQVELAAIAGTAKDMVYRAIAELEEAGALQRENGRIARLNRARLSELAETLKY